MKLIALKAASTPHPQQINQDGPRPVHKQVGSIKPSLRFVLKFGQVHTTDGQSFGKPLRSLLYPVQRWTTCPAENSPNFCIFLRAILNHCHHRLCNFAGPSGRNLPDRKPSGPASPRTPPMKILLLSLMATAEAGNRHSVPRC
jgi:hypothetical protein